MSHPTNEPFALTLLVTPDPTPEKPDRMRVELNVEEGADFIHLMCAAEFLMHVAATESGAGYERALEMLAQGAMTYRRPK